MQVIVEIPDSLASHFSGESLLKAHGVMIGDYTADDLRHEVGNLQRLGYRTLDARALFDLGASSGSNITNNKDAMIADAIDALHAASKRRLP